MTRDKIVVLDFGSQYAHLIAKRLRMMGYYSEIALPSADVSKIPDVKGIILSGGPASVYDSEVPEFNPANLEMNVPVLGLCYGHQLMAKTYGGTVGKADVGEFGFAKLEQTEAGKASPLFKGVSLSTQVWMSHQDAVLSLAPGFEVAATTKDCPFAAVQNLEKKRFSLQCHCEVKDTPEGNKIFQNFASVICGMERNWDEDAVLNHILESIKKDAEGKNVLLFLSGGVDSTVAFALLNKALGQERVLGFDQEFKVGQAHPFTAENAFGVVEFFKRQHKTAHGHVHDEQKHKKRGQRHHHMGPVLPGIFEKLFHAFTLLAFCFFTSKPIALVRQTFQRRRLLSES